DDELTDADLVLAVEVGWAGFHAANMLLVELQLGGIFDGDDALVGRDERGADVEERRLPGAGSTRDQEVRSRHDAGLEETDRLVGDRAEADEVLGLEGIAGELSDGE